jgi:hypothetical protein
MNNMDKEDIYSVLHPKEIIYTFFSAGQGTFSNIDHFLGHKVHLNKNTEVIPCILIYQME